MSPLAQQADLPPGAKLEYAAPRRGTGTRRKGPTRGVRDMPPIEICVSEMPFPTF